MEELKKASNFELNVLKLGVQRIQLAKGDRFTSNGAAFQYVPSTEENKSKMRFNHYRRETSISAKKYQKDVERADNIELVIDRGLSRDEPDDSEYNVLNRWREWEVKYAYTQPAEEFEPLIIMIISDRDAGDWEFKAIEHKVVRDTKQQLHIRPYDPITCKNQIDKAELNKPATYYREHYLYCRIEDYDQMELELFKYAKQMLQEQIQNAKDLVKEREESLINFSLLKEKQGHI
jgi:hypothetical protein